MGVELYMRTENLKTDEKYQFDICMDRNFQGLTTSAVYSLKKLGELYDIDISFLAILNQIGIDDNPNEGYINYLENLILETSDKEEIKKIKAELAVETDNQKERKKNPEEAIGTDIEKCEQILQELIQKIKAEPNMMLGFLDPEILKDPYFYFANKDKKGVPKKVEYFITEFERILDFLKFSKKNGAKKFAFFVM